MVSGDASAPDAPLSPRTAPRTAHRTSPRQSDADIGHYSDALISAWRVKAKLREVRRLRVAPILETARGRAIDPYELGLSRRRIYGALIADCARQIDQQIAALMGALRDIYGLEAADINNFAREAGFAEFARGIDAWTDGASTEEDERS